MRFLVLFTFFLLATGKILALFQIYICIIAEYTILYNRNRAKNKYFLSQNLCHGS